MSGSLHFRSFDGDGRMVVDTDEKKPAGKRTAIERPGKVESRPCGHPTSSPSSEKDQLVPAVHRRRSHESSRSQAVWHLIGMLLKANLWEVLAIIGVVQILLLPVIAASTRVRTIAWIACAVVHLLISYSFNFFFVYGKPNWMDDAIWGLTGRRGLGRRLLRHPRLGDSHAAGNDRL